jgi:hypothetical protein
LIISAQFTNQGKDKKMADFVVCNLLAVLECLIFTFELLLSFQPSKKFFKEIMPLAHIIL